MLNTSTALLWTAGLVTITHKSPIRTNHLSKSHHRIEVLQLDECLGSGKLPIDFNDSGSSIVWSGLHLIHQSGLISYAPIWILSNQNARSISAMFN
jgi:hypothetical protein